MIGKLLDHRYQVIRVLAMGGFGQTYIAQDTRRLATLFALSSTSNPELTPEFLILLNACSTAKPKP